MTRLIAINLSILLASSAMAHQLDMGLLKILQNADASYSILWKTTNRTSNPKNSVPKFPDSCRPITSQAIERTSTHTLIRFKLQCSIASLENQTLQFATGEHSVGNVMVDINSSSAQTATHLLSPPPPKWRVPGAQSAIENQENNYFSLGFFHLLGGMDHLLFLVGLLVLLSSWWELVRVVTCFTLGHSLTLLLAAAGFVTLDSQPIELCIALSIALIGVEIAKQNKGQIHLFGRYPAILAGLFGLLHGLGFSGALRQIGLPEENSLQAIFFFNAGVEVAQLLFISIVIIPFRWATNLRPQAIAQAVAYCLGVTGFYWFLIRLTPS